MEDCKWLEHARYCQKRAIERKTAKEAIDILCYGEWYEKVAEAHCLSTDELKQLQDALDAVEIEFMRMEDDLR
jgi:hypothetical protein